MSALLSPWDTTVCERTLTGKGLAAKLTLPLTAFLASRKCPGNAIRQAMDWAIIQAKAKTPVISGFHSPLERSVLEVVLVAKSPAVLVLARDAAHATVTPSWLNAAEAGHLTIIGPHGKSKRLTADQSEERNDLVAALAQRIVIAYVSPGGLLSRHIEAWGKRKPVEQLVADEEQG